MEIAAWIGTVVVQGQSPGVCHVKLTFATGFTYSTDVTFASQSGGVCGGPQCKCGDILAPTPGPGGFTVPVTVNNPSDTCLAAAGEDAGADVSVEATDTGDAEASIVCPPLTDTSCSGTFVFAAGDAGSACPTYGDLPTLCVESGGVLAMNDPCDGLLTFTFATGADSESTYYFDAASKQIVGVSVTGNAGIAACIGGVRGFNATQALGGIAAAARPRSRTSVGTQAPRARSRRARRRERWIRRGFQRPTLARYALAVGRRLLTWVFHIVVALVRDAARLCECRRAMLAGSFGESVRQRGPAQHLQLQPRMQPRGRVLLRLAR